MSTTTSDKQGLNVMALIGRICVAVLFVIFGVAHAANFPGAIQEMAANHLPLPAVVAVGAILIQLVGAALLITPRYTRIGAAVLALFTIGATLIAHMPWGGEGPAPKIPQSFLILLNLAITGGLITIAAQRREG